LLLKCIGAYLNYEQLLDKAFKELPTLSVEKSDFQIPVADSLIQGSKTILKNIDQLSDKARRPQEDIAKYLSKELAAPVSINNHTLEISAKVNQQSLNLKIENYFKTYVVCKECGKPDTKFEQRERGYVTVVCEACGARYTVKIY
jgi:translation initiation factor 2 subunit 2